MFSIAEQYAYEVSSEYQQSLDMYEIKTSTNKYELYNGIICECENI